MDRVLQAAQTHHAPVIDRAGDEVGTHTPRLLLVGVAEVEFFLDHLAADEVLRRLALHQQIRESEVVVEIAELEP